MGDSEMRIAAAHEKTLLDCARSVESHIPRSELIEEREQVKKRLSAFACGVIDIFPINPLPHVVAHGNRDISRPVILSAEERDDQVIYSTVRISRAKANDGDIASQPHKVEFHRAVCVETRQIDGEVGLPFDYNYLGGGTVVNGGVDCHEVFIGIRHDEETWEGDFTSEESHGLHDSRITRATLDAYTQQRIQTVREIVVALSNTALNPRSLDMLGMPDLPNSLLKPAILDY